MLPPLSTLPQDNRTYRIDSIGNLQRNPSSSANHILSLSLSEIGGDTTARYSPLTEFGDKSNRLRYYISVGEFFSHCAGSVVQNGKLISIPTQSNFEGRLAISDASTKLISSAHREIQGERAEFVIPPQYYHFCAPSSLPSIVAIARDGDPYSVLIPTHEVVRFYHCGSSTLSQALFTSQITDLNFFANMEKTRFDRANRRLSVVLRKQFPDDDAIIIGRWIADTYAHKQSMAMWNALVSLRASARFHLSSPKEAFPFKGETTIRAYGVYLPTPCNLANQRFLVLSLLHCSYPLPFDELIVGSERPRLVNKEAEKGKADKENQEGQPYRLRPKLTPEATSDPFSNPTNHFDAAIVRVASNRFPKIKIIRQEDDSSSQKPRRAPLKEQSVYGHSTSDEASEENGTQRLNIVPADIQNNCGENSHHDFGAFVQICEELNKHSNFVHELTSIQLSPTAYPEESDISYFKGPYGKRVSSWAYVVEQNGALRPRRYMLKKLVTACGVQYLLCIERRPASGASERVDEAFAIYVFSRFDRVAVSNDLLAMLMDELTRTKLAGYVSTFTSFKLNVSPKKHRGDAHAIAKGIILKIQRNRWSTVPPVATQKLDY